MSDQTWNPLLRDQLAWHCTHPLRDRLDGPTDDEYFWEPAPGCRSVRPRGPAAAPVQGGSGAMTSAFAMPEPGPRPFTTIAWRLGHVLAVRNAATAPGAPAQLHAEYATWPAGVESLGETGLARPSGETEEPHADLHLHTHQQTRWEAS
jgi:hypothetical protein